MMFYHHHIAQNMRKSWLLLKKSKTFGSRWAWFDSEVWRDVKQMNGSATVMHTVTSDSLRVLTFLGRWQCPGHQAMMYNTGTALRLWARGQNLNSRPRTCSTQIVDTESDCSWPSPSQWVRDPAVQSWWWQGRLLLRSSVAWRGERPKIMFNDKKIWH